MLSRQIDWTSRLATLVLVAIAATRSVAPGQPILEGYVGRQVPTAMVARNLMRGSCFLRPEVDTGPSPSLFLVEPPIYAQVVALIAEGFHAPIGSTGRVVSAFMTALAGWGLFGMVRSAYGTAAGLLAIVVFGAEPVTIRYGRAFQPDVLAMGLAVAGLRLIRERGRWRTVVGSLLLATGIAQKPTWAYLLVGELFGGGRGDISRARRWPLALTLIPACLWYLHAAGLAGGSAGWDGNIANWLDRIAPGNAIGRMNPGQIGRDLLIRSFTPLGFGLALAGLAIAARGGPLRPWAIGAGVVLAVLLGKLHHDYYLLIAAPVVATANGVALSRLAGRSRVGTMALVAVIVASGVYQSRSTWRTPDEWRDAADLAARLADAVPPGRPVVAPEAVLYLADRRGARLETERAARLRSAREWRREARIDDDSPDGLIRFFRDECGASALADLIPEPLTPAHRRLIDAVRADPRSEILIDRPGRYLLIRFRDPTPP